MLDRRGAVAGQADSLELPENEVHLWVADHRVRRDELDSHIALLDPGERRRADRFRFSKDFRRFVVSHARVRSILGLYSASEPDALEIARRCPVCGSDEHGKPFLLDASGAPSPVRFSYSYSDELVAVAVSNGAEVGVDVERVVPGFAWREVAATALSSRERSLLEGLDGDAAVRGFFGMWTRKEAVSKASGRGLEQLTQMDTRSWTQAESGEFEAGPWVGKALDLPGHAAAVAAEGRSPYEWVVKETPTTIEGGA